MREYDPNWLSKQMRKYLDPDKPKPTSKKNKLIQMANELVRIEWVLRDLFDVHIPEGATAWRVHCPWKHEHSDKGIAKTYRVYPETNTSMCFATHGQFTPVRLWAHQQRLTYHEAAKAMLKAYQVGPVKENYRARMARLMAPTVPAPIDMTYVLHHLLPTHPKYIEHQHHPEVRAIVVEWSEADFSTDVEELKLEFNRWKVRLWHLLDSLP